MAEEPAESDPELPPAVDASSEDLASDLPEDRDAAVRGHLINEAAVVAGVLESSLDRAIGIDDSRIEWTHPLSPRSPHLDDALAIRFQQGETSWACLLPKWMLPDGSGTVTEVPPDLPARFVAAILPESLPFHQPRVAEVGELVDDDLWAGDKRPMALRVPCDGREEPIWIFCDLPAERQRIGRDRLHSVPVRVVVTLAEKRIEVGQLTSISPGTLITFTKPCEDLLDLYVNNQAFCRGEAVKIGEKFGLKVTELGAERPRQSPLLQPS